MKQNLLQQIVLYRYRYVIGYILFLMLLAGLLLLELTSVPQGISSAEMESAVNSSALQPVKEARMIDLPYHILQKISISLLGLSALSIKLPSVIIGILTGIGMLLLLKRWFKNNITLISALLAVTSSIFLIAGRTGTPDIMVICWATYLLLLATLITQEAKWQYLWKIIIGLVVGLSLYTPLSAYVLGAALIAGFFHPHARYTLKRYGGPQFTGALLLFAAAITPLGIGIWHNPNIAYELVGFSHETPSGREYLGNLGEVFTYLSAFTMPRIAEKIQPAFPIAMLVLIAMGLLRTLVDNYATRTYALLIWTAVIIPVIAIHSYHTVGLFVPAILFMAIGIETLIREWYSLFPKNPYARLTGLLPLVVLMCSVWYFNYTTYFNGYRHSSEAAAVYHQDFALLHADIADELRSEFATATIIVPENQKAFYSLLNPTHAFVASDKNIPSGTSELIVHETAYRDDLGLPSRLLVSDTRSDSLRWYVVKR